MPAAFRRTAATRIPIGAAALLIAAAPALAREAEPGDDRAPATAPQVVTPPAATPAPGTPSTARRHGADDGPSHVRHGRHRDGARHHARHGRGADDAPGHVRHNGADDGPNHR